MELYLKENDIIFGDEDFNTQIENEIKLIDKIVDEFDALNKKEKANLLMHFYEVYLNDKDIIKFLNARNKKHFNKIVPIHTKMEWENTVIKNGTTKYKKERCILECAITRDLILEGKTYSYDELAKLYNEGKIYPLYTINKEIYSFSEDKEEQKTINCFITHEMDVEKDDKGYKLLSLNPKDIATFIKLVEKNYNNSEIMSDIKEYTHALIDEFLQYENEVDIEPQITKLYSNINKK